MTAPPNPSGCEPTEQQWLDAYHLAARWLEAHPHLHDRPPAYIDMGDLAWEAINALRRGWVRKDYSFRRWMLCMCYRLWCKAAQGRVGRSYSPRRQVAFRRLDASTTAQLGAHI